MAIGQVGLNDQYINLMIDAFALAPEVNLQTEEKSDSFFKLAKTEFKANIEIGESVKITVPGEVTLFDYKGGNLPDVQYPTNTTISVTVKDGKGVFYAMNNVQAQTLNAMEMDKGMLYVKELALNGTQQFMGGIISTMAALYPMGRYNMNAYLNEVDPANFPTATTPIQLTQTNVFHFFSMMKALFKRGYKLSNVPRIPWIEGKMIAIIPPELEALINSSTRYQYTPVGFSEQSRGYIGQMAGWEVFTSDYVVQDTVEIGRNEYYQYHPVFGVAGESFGAIIQKELTMMQFIQPENFDNTFKGYGLYGTDPLRTDKYGSAAVTIDQTLGS